MILSRAFYSENVLTFFFIHKLEAAIEDLVPSLVIAAIERSVLKNEKNAMNGNTQTRVQDQKVQVDTRLYAKN